MPEPERPAPPRIRDDSFPMRGWGLPEAGELDRIAIVSPHLDDAVLSCGRFMAVHPGVTVVTVFAGNPDAYPTPQRLWDVQSGFGPDDDVMDARRAEDRAALAHLDATPLHLEFVEHTYLPGDQPVAPDVLAPVLVATLRELDPTLVIAPFGLANPDHDMTHRACMLARDELGGDVSWWLYEDNGYKHIPGMLAWRVSTLFRRQLWPTPVCPPVDHGGARKAAAVECYPSQLFALDDDWQIRAKLEAPAPEQFWRLAEPPAGWESLSGSQVEGRLASS
jgi:LmbE family N-acetylglucosaminyl deacetylase